MAKTTKSVVPIRSLQKFNKGDTVNSITIAGATALADVEINGVGDVILTLKRDNTKIDTITTTSELISVEKSANHLTILLDETKLTEFVNTLIANHNAL